MRKGTILFVMLAWVLLGSVAKGQTPEVKFEEATILVGRHELKVQVALSDIQRERGLMNRTSVAPCDGMIFIFYKTEPVAFWMKDTLIPLEVGYFDGNNVLREIYHLKPKDLTPIRSKGAVRAALELPEGEFEKCGIKVGDKWDFEEGMQYRE